MQLMRSCQWSFMFKYFIFHILFSDILCSDILFKIFHILFSDILWSVTWYSDILFSDILLSDILLSDVLYSSSWKLSLIEKKYIDVRTEQIPKAKGYFILYSQIIGVALKFSKMSTKCAEYTLYVCIFIFVR